MRTFLWRRRGILCLCRNGNPRYGWPNDNCLRHEYHRSGHWQFLYPLCWECKGLCLCTFQASYTAYFLSSLQSPWKPLEAAKYISAGGTCMKRDLTSWLKERMVWSGLKALWQAWCTQTTFYSRDIFTPPISFWSHESSHVLVPLMRFHCGLLCWYGTRTAQGHKDEPGFFLTAAVSTSAALIKMQNV